MDSDRNFLVGMAALQSGLITAAQLAEAGTEWMADRHRPLLDLLVAKGWISVDDRSTLEARVHDLERSTVEAVPSEGFARGDQEDDQPTRSWDSNGDQASFGGGPGGLTEGFGPRYINGVLHREGGLGRIWRAHDTVLGREVAIKDLRPDRVAELQPNSRRFVEEAKISSQLEHPNIIPVHDLVDWASLPFYTMRFLGNTTLKTAILQHHGLVERGEAGVGDWSLRGLLEAFLSVCNAIAFAHSKGVIHRDIKGQNVVIGQYGEVIVLDWGLAKHVDSADDPLAHPIPGAELAPDRSISLRTQKGQVVGTPNYMPPEQAAGDRDRIDRRSDIFGLGAMLYVILTGRPPFVGGDTLDVVRQAREDTPPAPRSIHPKTPAALESICLKAMQREPDERYQQVTDLAADVRRWLNDEPVSTMTESVIDRAGRWGRKHQPAVAGTVALLATALISLVVGGWLVLREKDNVIHEKENVVREAERTKEGLISAEMSLEYSIAAMNHWMKVVQTELPSVNDPATERVRLNLAETATKYVRGFRLAESREKPNLQRLLGDTLREAARVHQQAYQFNKAETLLKEAIQGLNSLGEAAERDPTTLDRLSEYHVELSGVASLRDCPKDAEPPALKALELCEKTTSRLPGEPMYQRSLARSLFSLAHVERELGKADRSIGSFRRGLPLVRMLAGRPNPHPNDATILNMGQMDMSTSLRHAGQLDDALANLKEVAPGSRPCSRRTRRITTSATCRPSCGWRMRRSWRPRPATMPTRSAWMGRRSRRWTSSRTSVRGSSSTGRISPRR